MENSRPVPVMVQEPAAPTNALVDRTYFVTDNNQQQIHHDVKGIDYGWLPLTSVSCEEIPFAWPNAPCFDYSTSGYDNETINFCQ